MISRSVNVCARIERLSASSQHRNIAGLRGRNAIHLVSLGAKQPQWKNTPCFASSSRFLSTPASSTTTKAAAPTPLPTAVPKKHKVELRPGPVKPAKSSPEATSSSPAQSAADEAVSSTKPAASEPASASLPSLLSQTQQDLQDASQHGILPPPPENAAWYGKLFHQAKELFKFYVRGIKYIFSNRKRAQEMQERVKNGGPPLSRWETRFIKTCNEDMLKLIPFALIILIIEEIIPLVVIYAPFILPSTCILPSQKERIDSKKRTKQFEYAQLYKDAFEEVNRRSLATPSPSIKELMDSTTLKPLCGILALSTWGPDSIRLRRIQRQISSIAEDDALLEREGSGKNLNEAELRDALDERGIVTEYLPRNQWLSRLQWWLSQANSAESSSADPVAVRITLVARSGAGKV